MSQATKSTKVKRSNLEIFIMDGISIFLSLGPAATAWIGGILLIRWTWESPTFYWTLAALPFVVVALFITSVWVMRLCLPKLKPGVYSLGLNAGSAAWACHLALSRSVDISGLKPLIYSFFIFKFLYWRAAGARISFGIHSSRDISLVDLPMISIGKGSTLGDGAHLSAHTFIGDRLLVAPVEIGENVFIGMRSLIGARTKVGDHSWIGADNVLFRDTVPEGTRIPDAEWEKGNPKKYPERYRCKDRTQVFNEPVSSASLG